MGQKDQNFIKLEVKFKSYEFKSTERYKKKSSEELERSESYKIWWNWRSNLIPMKMGVKNIDLW